MPKRSAFLAFALSATLALPVAAPASAGGESSPASTRSASAKGCWYYSDNNYQGARAEIVEGTNPADVAAELNDKISSISCHPLCTLTAYDGAGQSGPQKKFNGDISYVGDAWNDKISSMAVTCRRRVRSM